MRVPIRLKGLVTTFLGDLEIDRLLMNDRELFTSEELKENEERKRELIELVASGEAVLVVGAGSSMRAGYVSLANLLEKLENLAQKFGNGFEPDTEKREDTPLAYAENIQSYIRDKTGDLDRYNALIYDLFKTKTSSVGDFHKTLVSLPFRGILTTNYDTVLEAALGAVEPKFAFDNSLVIQEQSAGRVDEFLMAMNNDSKVPRRIAHLHGKFDLSSSTILSTHDYKQAYGSDTNEKEYGRKDEWKLRSLLLWALFATRRVVFVGLSMEDPYLEKALTAVSPALWRWNKSIHYTIMGISLECARKSKDKADRLKSEYGIDTVFYDNSDGSHLRLQHIVAEMAKVCNIEISSPIDEDRTPSPINEDEIQSPIDGLDWLEQVTERMERKIDDENQSEETTQ